MLRVNPKFINKIRIYFLIRKINKSRVCKYKYGKAFILDVKKSGVFLDLIVPMTFGLITLCLVKSFGNKEIFRINWGK